MKREILFRGQRLNGKWAYGLLTMIWGPEHIIDLEDETVAYPVYPSTIGQYTGLTDNNGKRIFEGDIIKIPDNYAEFGHNAGEIYEVYFYLGGFRLKPKYSKSKGYWLEDDRTVKLIGNIYDTPELLEEET